MLATRPACKSCGADGIEVFYEAGQVPVHSCMALDDKAVAAAFPKRLLSLGYCQHCGFIFNVAFDTSVQEFSDSYEDRQCFSGRFRAFQTETIDRLLEVYEVRNKNVVEIGCGHGDFLIELCREGQNRGIGIDPRCNPQRFELGGRVQFLAEYYSERHESLSCDLVVCRHTLEHIPDVGLFMRTLRRTIGDRPDMLVFFEVPDMARILREAAFWDVYYEHCSYFGEPSLERLFRMNGFEIVEIRKDYADQYLSVMARPSARPTPTCLFERDDLVELKDQVDSFAQAVRSSVAAWRARLRALTAQGHHAAIWGSGSKCVSFLTTLSVTDEVDFVVDINPEWQGKFLAGSGKPVVSPDFLRTSVPDVIFVMNAVYQDEIRTQLNEMGVRARLVPA